MAKFNIDARSSLVGAVEATTNIANFQITGGANPKTGDDESPELVAIARRSLEAQKPMPVAEIADHLGWDSARTAKALVRGEQTGRLKMFQDDNTTKVLILENNYVS